MGKGCKSRSRPQQHDRNACVARGARQQEAEQVDGHGGSLWERAKTAQEDAPLGQRWNADGPIVTGLADASHGAWVPTAVPNVGESPRLDFEFTPYGNLEKHRGFCE